MSREPLVVSFDANSPLLTHFNVANEVRGADSNPAVLGPEQVHHGVKKKKKKGVAKMEVCGTVGSEVQQTGRTKKVET